MISLLNQLVVVGVLRSLDVQFACLVASTHEPDIQLAAAYLSAETGAGHACLNLEQLQLGRLFAGQHPKLAQAVWLAAGQPDISKWKKRLIGSAAVGDGGGATPLVLHNQRLYLHRMWRSEGEIAVFIRRNCQHEVVDEVKLRTILDKLFGVTENKLDWQKIAVAVAITRRIAVISGGPGTGKTTTVTKLLASLLQLNEHARIRIQLAAPTGKAAARLTESLSNASRKLLLTPAQLALFPTEATTLHSLLGIQANSQRMRYNRNNPLHLDVLVVDEASMIDLSMMARLITSVPERARLIFLGDRDQLASVETGAVLGDICCFAEQGYSEERAAELSRLTGCILKGRQISTEVTVRDSLCLLRKSYRFNTKSGIGQLAAAVNSGDITRARKVINGSFNDVKNYSLATSEEYQALLVGCVAGYCSYLKQVSSGAAITTVLAAFGTFQVVCALRIGPFGVTGLNYRIESELHHAGLIFREPGGWYLGRPIMIVRNDKSLGLYNGDIGITLRDGQGNLCVHFLLPDGNIKLVQPNRLPTHVTTYAMTVHKSQGSEFDHTLLVLPTHFLPLLTRELIYTAITRARMKLSLYAIDRILMKAIRTPTLRRSGLMQRVQKNYRQ